MPSVYKQQNVVINETELTWGHAAPTDWVARPFMVDHNAIWITIYFRSETHFDTTGRHHISFSADQGETWTAEDTYLDGSAVTGPPYNPTLGGNSDAAIIVTPTNDLLLHIPQGVTVPETRQWRSADGGKTWSDEGIPTGLTTVNANHDGGCNVGSDIYITGAVLGGGSGLPHNLYKSTDDGATWSLVSQITSEAENCSEGALMWLGGERLLCMLRGIDSNTDDTFQRESDDLGATWGTLRNLTDEYGWILHRARLDRIGSRIYVTGRIWGASTVRHNALFWSDDDGETWSTPFVLQTDTDAGYVSILRRGDRSFYAVGYAGSEQAAWIFDYELDIPSHTPDKDAWLGG